MDWISQPLYGGAITISLPKGLLDASDIRQVPDTQEVFLCSSESSDDYSRLSKDDTLIVDLMEMIEETEVTAALNKHLQEIASLNESEDKWLRLNQHTVEVRDLGER